MKICRTAADIRALHRERHARRPSCTSRARRASTRTCACSTCSTRAGLRSIGPVWSRSNIFGHGVPFRYPVEPRHRARASPISAASWSAPATSCKIMIDLSHLNEKGFWDVAKISDAPLVATHSNAHAICPHSRNLTDKQLAAIRESRGMVGRELRHLVHPARRPAQRRHAARRDDPPHGSSDRACGRRRCRPRLRFRRRHHPGRDRRRRAACRASSMPCAGTATTTRPCASSAMRTGSTFWSAPGAGKAQTPTIPTSTSARKDSRSRRRPASPAG